jgi:hypothetical protein
VPRAFFFQTFSASAGPTYTADAEATFLSQFPFAQRDGVAMQSGNLRQLLDASTADLRGK